MIRTVRPSTLGLWIILIRNQLKQDLREPLKLLIRTFAAPLYMVCAIGLTVWFASTAPTSQYQTFARLPLQVLAPLVGGESSTFFVAGNSAAIVDALLPRMQAIVDFDYAYFPDSQTNFTRSAIETYDEFESFCESASVNSSFQGGVFVENDAANWKYSLFVPGQTTLKASNVIITNYYEIFKYTTTSSLALQRIVENAIVEQELGLLAPVNTYGLSTTVLPLPDSAQVIKPADWWKYAVLGMFGGFSVQFSVYFTFPGQVGATIAGIPRAIQLMGHSQWSYWTFWLVYLSIWSVPASIVAAVILKYALFVFPNVGLFWAALAYFLTHLGAITQLLFFTDLVKKQSDANGIPFLLALFAIAVSVLFTGVSIPIGVVFAVIVLSPSAGWSLFIVIAAQYDIMALNLGITTDTLVVSNVLWLYCAMIGGIILHGLIAYSKFGDRKLLQRVLSRNSRISPEEQFEVDALKADAKLEELTSSSKVVLDVRGLRKSFRNVSVLKGVDLQICQGEVFGFLGHNGAGKSVTCALLGGELIPNGGEIRYHLNDSEKAIQMNGFNSSKILQRCGFCLQQNVFFEKLTGREQLVLACELKGGIENPNSETTSKAIEDEVEKIIRSINFDNDEDIDKPISTYSGGMKRRICIAMALIGDPQIVFLDEPTAGVDPLGRRSIWDMIENAKQGRSIVLTTHFMDEADALSDRIAILNNGLIKACGTSLYLKNEFTTGVKISYLRHKNGTDINMPSIVPNSKLGTVVEMSDAIEADIVKVEWNLPGDASGKVPEVLRKLEMNGLNNGSASLTTLEEVFMKVGANDADKAAGFNRESVNQIKVQIEQEDNIIEGIWKKPTESDIYLSTPKLVRGIKVIGRSVMFNPFMICCSLLIPLLLLIAGVAIVSTLDTTEVERVVSEPFEINSRLLWPKTPATPKSEFQWTVFGVPSNQSLPNDPYVEFVDTTFTNSSTGAAFVSNSSVWYLGGKLTNSTVMFNLSRTHALPVLQSLYTDMWLESTEASVQGKIQPLPYDKAAQSNFASVLMPGLVTFAFMGVASLPVVAWVLQELHILELMRSYGYSQFETYFSITVPFFIMTVMMPTVIFCLSGLVASSPLFGSGGRGLASFLAVLAYGFAVFPLCFSARKLFNSSEQAGSWMTALYITFSIVPVTLAGSLSPNDPDHLVVFDGLTVLPTYAIHRAISLLYSMSAEYNDPNIDIVDVFRWENRISFCICILIAFGVVFWVIVVVQIQLDTVTNIKGSGTKAYKSLVEEEGAGDQTIGEGVAEERERAFRESTSGGLRVRNISKRFRTSTGIGYSLRMLNPVYFIRKVLYWLRVSNHDPLNSVTKENQAVSNLSFGLDRNQVFILLGPNGCGKSTSCGVIIRQISPDHGEVLIDDMKESSARSFRKATANGALGFLPQHNTHFPTLNVRQNILAGIALRGLDIKHPSIQHHFDCIVKGLGLDVHLSKKPEELSGGFQRKLNLALSLCGFPTLLILDEMSSGVDPAARAHINNIFIRGREIGASKEFSLPGVLLSTHVMDEARSLATRIGIMVKGKLVVSGTTQELSKAFCRYNIIDMVFDSSKVAQDPANESGDGELADVYRDAIETLAQKGFPCTIKEQQGQRVVMKTDIQSDRSNVLQIADLFDCMEAMKSELGVKYYSVAPMGIEDIFIDVANGTFEHDKVVEEVDIQLSKT